MNNMRGITEMTLNLDELDNTVNLEVGRPSNALITYHVTVNENTFRTQNSTVQET